MDTITEFLRLFNAENIMGLLLFTLILVVMISLTVVHLDKTDNINLEDLISTNNKLDGEKFARFGAWIVSTWGFIYLVVMGQLTEWYFVGYIGVWVTNAIFDKYMNEKKSSTG
jgi:hypothetical protein